MTMRVGLEDLVVSPYRWAAGTYSSFVRDAYNIIKKEMQRLHSIEVDDKRKKAEVENDGKRRKPKRKDIKTGATENQSYNPELALFVDKMKAESSLVLGNDSWLDVLEPKYWNLLKLDKDGNDRYKLDNDQDESVVLKRKSVVHLFKFIRDMIEHIRTLNDDMKEKLAQFFDKDDKREYHFNENNFISFWISKFPKLMPFLWLRFHKYREKLEIFYPSYDIDINRFEDFLLDLNVIENGLQVALFSDLENGNVLKRFKGPGCSLELREFQNLDKNSDKLLLITFSGNSNENVSLSVSHTISNKDKMEYAGSAPGTEKLVLIFVNNITDDKVWNYWVSRDCRTIVFCDLDYLKNEKVDKAVAKFVRENSFASQLSVTPIQGCELSIDKQNWLFEQGKVMFQGKVFKLKDVFLESSTMAGVLSGDLLTKLLKEEEPILCSEYKSPEYEGLYINRKLYFRDLTLYSMTDKFIRKKCSMDEREFLQNVYPKKTICIRADSGMGKSKLLISLGNRLKDSFVIFCSFRHFVDLLKERVSNRDCSKSDIKYVILEILHCKNDYERVLIDYWLDRKCRYRYRALIELQLDSLDEVSSGNLNLALRAWEIIEQDLGSVKLWVTSSKHFPNEWSGYRTAYFGICPFSEKDKWDFFKLAWSKKFVGWERNIIGKMLRNLFKHFCTFTTVSMTGEFTDFPLNCSMLAEVYEDKLYEQTPFKGSALDLYDALFKKRFAIMFKKMYGIVDENSCNFLLLRDTYLKLHTYRAFTYLFPENSDEFVKPLTLKFMNEQDYRQIGIITGLKPVTFLHATYAEAFVARYINTVLATDNLENLCSRIAFDNLLYFGTPDKSSENIRWSVWTFVEQHFKNKPHWYRADWLKTYKKDQHSLLMTKKMSPFLSHAFGFNMWNLATLLINVWVDKRDRSLCNEILLVAIKSGAYACTFVDICKKLEFDNQYELVMVSVKIGCYDIAMYLLHYYCGTDVFDRIAEMRKDRGGGGVLNCVRERILIKLDRPDLKSVNFDDGTIEFIRYVHEKSKNELERHGCDTYFLLRAVAFITTSMDLRADCSYTLNFLIEDLKEIVCKC